MSGGATDLVSLLLLGFFLGMRHATDADHVIAIATIVSRQRTLRGSVLIGAAWGIGHTLTMLAVGSAIILFGVVIPARVGLAMELAVGIMLVILGLLTLTGMVACCAMRLRRGVPCWSMRTLTATTWRSTITPMRTATTSISMLMPRCQGPWSPGGSDPARSARPNARHALALSMAATARGRHRARACGLGGGRAPRARAVRDPTWAIAYLLLLGAGTVAGMMLITVALAAPFAFSWSRLPRFNWQLRVASGLISLGFGLLLIYEIGFSAGGLFTAAPSWQPH